MARPRVVLGNRSYVLSTKQGSDTVGSGLLFYFSSYSYEIKILFIPVLWKRKRWCNISK